MLQRRHLDHCWIVVEIKMDFSFVSQTFARDSPSVNNKKHSTFDNE